MTRDPNQYPTIQKLKHLILDKEGIIFCIGLTYVYVEIMLKVGESSFTS